MSFEQKPAIDRFWGFEINWWPSENRLSPQCSSWTTRPTLPWPKARGAAPNRLPIRITAHIVHHDALSLGLGPNPAEPTGQTYVFGNPPFLGGPHHTAAQLALMQHAWGGTGGSSRLDFVTSWHALTLRLLENRYGEWAFVTTNSITQGDQTARLFEPISMPRVARRRSPPHLPMEALRPGKAAVHCVIIGFTRDRATKRRLWGLRHGAIRPAEVSGSRPSTPISSMAPKSSSQTHHPAGSRLADGRITVQTDRRRLFIITPARSDAVVADPVILHYVRPYVGSKELLSNRKRWCLSLRINPGPRALPSSNAAFSHSRNA
ncbi:hypothetical protein QJS66_23415 (plasmid) [Kocuria rhizophila]|nr:hypothetical protein QJS66_23415 [Kocuria rhizophila]